MNINKISTVVNTNQSGSTVPIRGYSVVRTVPKEDDVLQLTLKINDIFYCN
jgi:hypothetical protein